MAEKSPRPSILRIVSAILLGIVVGFFVFLGIALILGVMNIPVSMQFAENIHQRNPAYYLPGCVHRGVPLAGMDYSSDRTRIGGTRRRIILFSPES